LSVYKYANMYIENMNRETQTQRENEKRTRSRETHTPTMCLYILHTYNFLGVCEAHCST
jgi:hypothetical protein